MKDEPRNKYKQIWNYSN